MTIQRRKSLFAKIFNEGYCCLNGYLRLCRARGEVPKDMAENIGMGVNIIWHHYRKLKAGENPCKRYADCLGPIIEEIEAEKPLG